MEWKEAFKWATKIASVQHGDQDQPRCGTCVCVWGHVDVCVDACV